MIVYGGGRSNIIRSVQLTIRGCRCTAMRSSVASWVALGRINGIPENTEEGYREASFALSAPWQSWRVSISYLEVLADIGVSSQLEQIRICANIDWSPVTCNWYRLSRFTQSPSFYLSTSDGLVSPRLDFWLQHTRDR